MYEYLADANSMLNNILKLQFQQILKHPHIVSIGTSNLSKIYTYKTIDKNRHTKCDQKWGQNRHQAKRQYSIIFSCKSCAKSMKFFTKRSTSLLNDKILH